MKVDINSKGDRYSIEFRLTKGDGNTHFVGTPKSSRELDIVKQIASDMNVGDTGIGEILAKAVSNRLKLPVEYDYGYKGYGYGLKLDLYSIIKQKLN